MKELFAADSPLQRVLGRLGDVMILNLLFLVTSLPLVTLGASLTALNFAALRLVEDSPESATDAYLRSFRQNLRQSFGVLAVAAVAVAVLVAWAVVLTQVDAGPLAGVLLWAALVLLALRLIAVLLFLFPYFATFEGSTREVISNARKMSARHPLAALGMTGVLVLPLAVTVTDPALAGYGLFWLLAGFSGIACVNALLLRRVLARYTGSKQS
ncbi:DUF624 domain-containing protein [Brachybacterium sp. J144]|uniref:DUF624 domain-containing protein n=1 Tax=Brachybacterium sp. J144 TaxID=3116487 RepID=UPI002E775123|nr:DUF624 domain-containing protein [Brachybacterium sp. J144]MEE1650608.1 DUF624 domain-containing protein [Brachybacterium sp. J144]